ncbi:ankyrin repeat domain-containing protein 6-like isoform X1 [Macrosteles quadrilineatus]|uniref:ankyrin repeat domain-containing protein 6-like isoform X1 n=1 Tax=Macrosteles quadrilineatus TaxID=74068 RepID=UPI0023E1C6BC|nr:ankyrin repeat domain-containing protein 6-like isoform X1 [Macrosteles quadrilineatus]
MLAEEIRAAAVSGHVQDLARLLARSDPNKFLSDSDGRTALHLAASAGHVEVISPLVLAGAPVNAIDSSGCTALQLAASEGHEQVIEQLLKHGANPNNQDIVHGNTALHEASWKGFSRTVAALCKGKTNMHIKNLGGFAPLHLCCQNGHNQSCRELLIAGCSPDLQNNYGDTPLHTSARYGHAGVTRILISAHCRVSDQNKNGDTALHIAAAMGRRKMTRILLEAGCDKSLRNKQQETAKDIATRKDLNEILNILNNTKRSSSKKKEEQDKTDGSKQKPNRKDKRKQKSDQKVHFEKLPSKNWSPYGCHYYPDSKAFPPPKLDSLPNEPLHKGEQYFLDLAGNIRKGPVGVGYTCYCAPFFQHMEARMERDKEELKKHITSAEKRIDKKVQNLERQTEVRISQLRKQHQHLTQWLRGESYLPRTRSLDLLDDKSLLNENTAEGATEIPEERRLGPADHRSMDDLCSERESDHGQEFNRPTDKVGLFWRSQFASERLQRYRDKTKCPDLVSSVTKTEKCNASPHNEECSAVREVEGKDVETKCDKDCSDLPSWRRQELRKSVHEIVSRVQALHWRRSGDVREQAEGREQTWADTEHFTHSDSSDGEECERPGPWSEVKRLPYRSRSAVYSPTLDRDNNDSGYSTKICSNSQGPSPSLSGRLQGDDPLAPRFYLDQPGLPSDKHATAVPFLSGPSPTNPQYPGSSPLPHPQYPGSSPLPLPQYPGSSPLPLPQYSGSSPLPLPQYPGSSPLPQYSGSSPLTLSQYPGPTSSQPLPHFPITSDLTTDRFTARECQNLHTEASLV